MGKNNRHQKNLKSEKAKVKLKTKKPTKPLPKGLNVTDTSFKVKKIIIREQLKQHEENEILSRRKLNVKDLLTRLQHHNCTVRQEAVRELKEILSQHSTEILSSQLRVLLQGIAALALDREKDIRRESLKVLNMILGPISNDQLRPFSDVLVSYLCCAMTHIDPNIKEDSLLFLDVLAENCRTLLAENAHKVLPNFLNMISKLRTESQPGRLLVTALSCKNTSVKWRSKVLTRLSSILASIVGERKSRKLKHGHAKTIVNTDDNRRLPIYNSNNLQLSLVDFDRVENNSPESNSDLEELTKYTKVLMPLMLDSWLEVTPTDKSCTSDRVISAEAACLLKSISDVVQLIIEYFELLEETENGSNSGRDTGSDSWLRDNFFDSLGKKLLDKFPYSQMKSVQKPRKRQQDFTRVQLNDKCLEQNLSLCYAYVWILSSNKANRPIEDSWNKETCERILEYANETLRNWSSSDVSALAHLIKFLRVLFLRASKIFYKSGMTLGETLRSVIDAHSRGPRRELHSQLFAILGEIVLNHELEELHAENAFKQFVTSLPDLLLKNSIHESTLKMLNRVVLQYGRWIHQQLATKHESIIENVKKIEIIGSEDEKRSRLAICNLFYFIDEQIYY